MYRENIAPRVLPEKTLYNIGMDTASSDYVLMSPLYATLVAIDGEAEKEGVGGEEVLQMLLNEAQQHPGYAIVMTISNGKCI